MAADRTATRACSKQTCNREAVCTLTYVYSDSTAVIGPLSSHREPHAYDLCTFHADALTAPRGWRVVRLETTEEWGGNDPDDAPRAVDQDDELAARRAPTRHESHGTTRSEPAQRALRDVSYRGADPAPRGGEAQDPGSHTVAGAGAPADSDGSAGGAQAGESSPVGPVPTGDSTRYAEQRSPVADAHGRVTRSASLPEALRVPHWRRP